MHHFGPFEVDFSKSEMRKSGIRVRIQEQPLRLLEILLESPGELVTREQIRDRLWQSDTFVDFERSLNAAVAKLRQALNDSAEHPLYVETVARRGYRFIAPVAQSAKVPDVLPVALEVLPPRKVVRRIDSAWIVAGLLAVALVMALWAPWRTPRSERLPVWLDLDVGDEVSQPAVSPDGSRIVFVTGGRLATRRLDEEQITPLARTEGASFPFFSPTGQWVGFFANGRLQKIPVEGGSPVTLCEAPIGRGGSWGEDGRIIAALNPTGGLSVVSALGGTPEPFSDLKTESKEITNHRWPQVLPGGKGVLFIAGTGTAIGTLRVLPTDGPPKTLVENSSRGRYVDSGYLVYHQGGMLFARKMDIKRLELIGRAFPLLEKVAIDNFRGPDFDVSSSGTLVYRRSPAVPNHSIMWLDSAGGKRPAVKTPNVYGTPRLSPDGKQLAVSARWEGQLNLGVIDLARGSMRRLTFEPETQFCPVWSPDGEYIAFASRRLSWVRSDGSGKVDRLAIPNWVGDSVPWSFSPDGKWLAFHHDEPPTGYDLWIAPVERVSGAMRLGRPRPLLRRPGIQAAPAFSPDGRWVAYGSDESGRVELYVMPFSVQDTVPEGKWQVTSGGGMSPLWSPSGHELFYRGMDRRVMAANYRANGNSFVVDKPRVWSETRLADVGPLPSFDIAPDGKRVVALLDIKEAKPDETHLRVLLHAGDELRRRDVALQTKE